MNGKSLKILVWLLLGVALIWYGQDQLVKRNSSSNTGIVMFDPTGDSQSVKRIVIEKKAETIAMTLKDGIWFVESDKPLGEDRAIQDKANALVKVLDGTNGEIVSTNEKNHTSLGIDENLASKVTYYGDDNSNVVAVLRVSSLNSAHVREDKKVNVYEWSSDLAAAMNTSMSAWIEVVPTQQPEATSSSSQ